jgi:hypothetical protein
MPEILKINVDSSNSGKQHDRKTQMPEMLSLILATQFMEMGPPKK